MRLSGSRSHAEVASARRIERLRRERMITFNGNSVSDVDQLSIAELLAREQYNPILVAVECNGEIVPKAQYAHRRLQDGDLL